jgi:hypothetical protein
MLPFAKSKRPGRVKKKNTAARFKAAISKDEVKPQSPKTLNPKIVTKKTTEFKLDVECELQNRTKQAALRPKMVDFELGIDDDGTTLIGVLIKCHHGRKDNICVLEEDIAVVYFVDEAMKKWYEGADMEKPDVCDMADEVQCTWQRHTMRVISIC